VFLRNTEGAYAVNNGNRLISLFTNIPDQIDKAVLSRIQSRVAIDGADDDKDFLDQDFIWWRKYEKISPGFVNMKDPNGYEYMKQQKDIASLSQVYQSDFEFTQSGVKDVYESTLKSLDTGSHEFFSHFYTNIQKRYPFFSSRDLRNIQKAVDARIIDFDLPEVWWENPETFFQQDYDTKLNMLRDLMKSNIGDMSFADIRLREALTYVDTAVRINETGVERDISQTAEKMHIQQEAAKRLRNGELVLDKQE
jgi:hypothetical protein